jgi:hypothetical protein
MTEQQYGDCQFEIYCDGLEGRLPNYPVDYGDLESSRDRDIAARRDPPRSRVNIRSSQER